MWIAKPLAALSLEERMAWIESQRSDRPLSQTLVWAEAALAAIQELEGQVIVIFNPDEKVGGIIHSAGHPQDFECTNGPVLDWESAEAPRQIATFAMAASKAVKNLRTLTLHPRWSESSDLDTEAILEDLPIPAENLSRASTWVVDLKSDFQEQRAGFTDRMRRTLDATQRAGVRVEQLKLDTQSLSRFAQGMHLSGQQKGFYVPDERWFQALVAGSAREAIRFFLVEAQLTGKTRTQLFCCISGATAYFLFGFDEKEPAVSGNISTAALAHEYAMHEASRQGALIYDFNGFIDPNVAEHAGHPYLGVSRFKAQFGGRVIDYVSPEFKIETGIS